MRPTVSTSPSQGAPPSIPGVRETRRRGSFGAAPVAALLVLVFASVACAGGPTQDPGAAEREAAQAGASSTATEAADTAAAQTAAEDAATAAAVHEILGEGVDVSSHVGEVDWAALRAAGHTFAFIKATEGVDLADPSFETWWPAMKEAGIVRGAYHFYVTEDDPEAQAQFFISRATLDPGDLAPVVDVELIGHGTEPGLADRLRTFLSILEGHYGVKPIIYTGPNFWNANVGEGFGDHPLWVAEYGVDQPAIPAGWTEWHLWQHTGDAAVPGVEKSVDLSRVNPSAAVDLSRLVVPPPVAR